MDFLVVRFHLLEPSSAFPEVERNTDHNGREDV
jgi:hypothetical protein